MAVSRACGLRRILVQGNLRISGLRARLLSTEVTEEVNEVSNVGRNGGKIVVGQELALMRREYEKQMSELRKKYAAEEERKKKEKRQVEQITRERITVDKEKRAVIKSERATIRALEVEEERKALRARLEEERKARAARRQYREKRFLRLLAREKESVRQESSMWIEEKDLERRILDALVDPFYLSGSYALPDRDGPMTLGDDSEDGDDDEQ